MKPPIRQNVERLVESARGRKATCTSHSTPNNLRTTFGQHLFACASDQPLQDSVEVGLFLRADAVAAHLTVRHRLKIQSIDELVHRKLVGKVGLVAEDQQGNALQRRLLQQELEFFTCYR
jgi:hypothetical protein